MRILELLDLIKQKIENLNPVPEEYLISHGNMNGFELLVPKVIEELISELHGSVDINQTVHYGKVFPDIDLQLNGKTYGLELKSRNNGSWDVPGNSVFESFAEKSYEEIYLIFGSHKKGIPRLKVKYKPYWQATTGISVTHSPRFKINMNANESVFSTAEDYKNLQSLNEESKVKFLQEYLKNNTSGLKWFVPPAPDTIKPTHLNSLNDNVKIRVISEALILFPQDLLRARGNDYTQTSEYLLVTYFYYSHSLRDFFSAGGQWEINGVRFPQTIKRLYDNRKIILDILQTANNAFQEMAHESWKDLDFYFEDESFQTCYMAVLNYIGDVYFSDELKQAGFENLADFLFEL